MSLDGFRRWLFGSARPVHRRASLDARRSRTLRFYSPSVDVLEDRRLLSVSVSTGAEAAAQVSPLATPVAQIVARNVFYNNSRFDAYTPGASTADDAAIA